MSRPDVTVVGLGLAGSLTSLRLAELGFNVVAYERAPLYSKPCGEQLTLDPIASKVANEFDVVKTVVDRVEVFIDGRYVTTVDMRPNSKWAIIDKPRLVMTLREQALGHGVTIVRGAWNGKAEGLTIDSRGPYAGSYDDEVLAVRVLSKVKSWDPGLAWLDFRPGEGGLYWVFPYDDSGKIVNAGAGFIGLKDARRVQGLTERYLRSRVDDNEEPLEVKGAPIDITSRPTLERGGLIKVGEAAGLVMAWSGEGNRPAILSAEYLARAVGAAWDDRASIIEEYSRLASELMATAILSRLMARISLKSKALGRLLERMPHWTWERYVKQELTLKDLLRAIPEGAKGASKGQSS